MAPLSDPADLGLADLFAQRGDAAAHGLAWLALALFLASLLAIWDERRAPGRGRPRGAEARPHRRCPRKPT